MPVLPSRHSRSFVSSRRTGYRRAHQSWWRTYRPVAVPVSILIFGALVFGLAIARSSPGHAARPTPTSPIVTVVATASSPAPTMTPWGSATPGIQPLAAIPARHIYCTPNAGPTLNPAATARPPSQASSAPRATPAPSLAPSAGTLSMDLAGTQTTAGSVQLAVARGFFLCVPVLEYHRIVPPALAGNSLPGLVMPPDTFAAQLAGLRKAGWHTITLSALAGDLTTHRSPPARTFVVTIDDGWFDGYTYALPILRQNGFVATYFVISSRIGRTDFLSAAQLKTLIADGDEIGNHTVTHASLTYMTEAQMKYEVDAASLQIAAATGVRPRSFAYPIGGLNPIAATVVATCPGLQIAVTEQRAIGETYAGRFAVPRLEIGPSVTASTLLIMLQG